MVTFLDGITNLGASKDIVAAYEKFKTSSGHDNLEVIIKIAEVEIPKIRQNSEQIEKVKSGLIAMEKNVKQLVESEHGLWDRIWVYLFPNSDSAKIFERQVEDERTNLHALVMQLEGNEFKKVSSNIITKMQEKTDLKDFVNSYVLKRSNSAIIIREMVKDIINTKSRNQAFPQSQLENYKNNLILTEKRKGEFSSDKELKLAMLLSIQNQLSDKELGQFLDLVEKGEIDEDMQDLILSMKENAETPEKILPPEKKPFEELSEEL